MMPLLSFGLLVALALAYVFAPLFRRPDRAAAEDDAHDAADA